MRRLFEAGKLLLLDMASTLFFLALYLWTNSIPLSVALGIALGIAQIVSKLALFLTQYAVMRSIGVRRRRAQMMQAQPCSRT